MARILNFDIFEKKVSQIDIYSNKLINTINPHSYCVAKKDKSFENVLQDSDILLPDGIGIVWATKVLTGKKITKIAGYDLFIHTMNPVSYTHLRAHETEADLVCRLLLEKKK